MDWVLPLAVALGWHLGLGLVFGLAFVTLGIGRVDPAARGAGLGFRLLVLPGVALLWPLLAWRWATIRRGPGAGSPAPGETP